MGHFSVCGMILDVDECSFCLNLGGLRHSAGISYVYVRIRPQKHLDIVFLICPSPTLSSSSCNLALLYFWECLLPRQFLVSRLSNYGGVRGWIFHVVSAPSQD